MLFLYDCILYIGRNTRTKIYLLVVLIVKFTIVSLVEFNFSGKYVKISLIIYKFSLEQFEITSYLVLILLYLLNVL